MVFPVVEQIMLLLKYHLMLHKYWTDKGQQEGIIIYVVNLKVYYYI